MKNIRLLYYKNPLLRPFINVAARLSGRPVPNTRHLVSYREEDVMGPLQREEALALFSLIRVTRPQTVVEFGFHCGHSAFNFLRALEPSARLYSFDIANESQRIATECFSRYPNFRFQQKSQTEFDASDVDARPVDFVLLDAAHQLDLNKQTWKALMPCLSPTAIIAVHDTGTWVKQYFSVHHQRHVEAEPNGWLNDNEFPPCPEERLFVNWVAETYPEFQALHLHSLHCIRNGITLLQKQRVLP